jgi:hypothetical protein
LRALCFALLAPSAIACSRDAKKVESVPQALNNPPAFATFETGQVRPLALSPSGLLLFATNTPLP